MSHVVTKPFKSLNRKFTAGDKIAEADIISGHHFTFQDWIDRGFIKDESAAPAPVRRAFAQADTE